MFGLQARTKKTIFLRLLKGECDEPGFSTRVKAKKFARGEAMVRRRLQRRRETKGRRLKTTPCTWDGSLSHDELGEILGRRPRPARLRLVPFLSHRQCSAACVDSLRCSRMRRKGGIAT